MIVKEHEETATPSDRRCRAGFKAERQMAHYLNRAYATDESVLVLNNVRLVDSEQPEQDGRPSVCQIDHLLMHRFGVFIIESKSVSEKVVVGDDGSGGDEWKRQFRGREEGMPSPIQQARRQGEFLRAFLHRHRAALLSRVTTGLRTVSRLINGTDQRGFRHMPIQIIVAISDRGEICRVNRWKEPDGPFPTFVCKADLVTEKVRKELARHHAGTGVFSVRKGEYGIWQLKPEELTVVAKFLAMHHQPAIETTRPNATEPSRSVGGRARAPRKSSPLCATQASASMGNEVAADTDPACKKCRGTDLTVQWGRFGYYWKCNACQENTAIPTVCSVCGTKGHRGQTVRIRKRSSKYYRACEKCGIDQLIWTA